MKGWFAKVWSSLLVVYHFACYFYENGSLPQIVWPPLFLPVQQRLLPLWNLLQKPFEFLLRYARDWWLDEYISNLQTLWAFWQRGWLGRLELSTVILGGLAVPAVLFFTPQDAVLSPAVLMAGLGLYGLAYSLALAAASHLALGWFVLIGIGLIWYLFIIGGSLAGSILFVLPSLWLLCLGILLALHDGGRRRFLWLALLCLAVAYLTYGSLGVRRLFGNDAAALIVLSLVYLGFVCGLIFLLPPKMRPVRPSAGFVFTGTLAVVFTYFSLAGVKDSGLTADYAILSARGLLGLVDLFWMWLGATLVESSLDTGSWWTDESFNLLTPQLVRRIIPLLWITAGLLGCWLTFTDIPAELSLLAYQSGLQEWVFSWDDSLFFSVQAQVWVSLVIMGLWLLALLFKKGSTRLLGILNGLWIAAFITILAFNQSLEGFATLEEDALPPADVWLAILLVFGLVWEMTLAGESYWESEHPARHLGLSAFLAYMLSISLLTLGAGLPDLVAEYTFYSFNGIIYLGLPMLVYLIVKNNDELSMLTKGRFLILVGAGALSAVPPLVIDPQGNWSLLLAPLIWGIVLFIVRGRPRWFAGLKETLLAGGALAVGFVTYWMSPEVIPVPFLGFVQSFEDIYLTADLQRPLLEMGQVWITLAALLAAVIVSTAVYHLGHRDQAEDLANQA